MATPNATQAQSFPEHAMDLSSITSANQSGFFMTPVMPHKLDADQYSAEDLDGVTESLFGTGNMNFLMMQDAQINGAALGTGDAFAANAWETPMVAAAAMAGLSPIANTTQSFAGDNQNDGDFAFDARHLSSATPPSALHINDQSSNPYNSNHNAQDLSLSQINNNVQTWGTGSNGLNGTNGTNTDVSNNTLTTITQTLPGRDGTDGTDGTNTGGGDTIITIIDNSVTEVIETVTTITETITETIVTVIKIIPDLLCDLLDSGSDDTDVNIGGGVNIGGIELPLNPILPLEVIIDPIEDLIGDLDLAITPNLDLFGDGEYRNDHGDTDVTIKLDTDLLDNNLLDIDLHLPLDPIEALLGDIDLDITGSLNLLGDVASPLFDDLAGGTVGTITAAVGDVVQDLVGTLIGTGAGHDGDTDLAVGLPIGDAGLNLDIVENLVGDIDLGVGTHLDLLGDGEYLNSAGDTDVNVGLGIDILDTSLLSPPTIEIPLDIVESILGDLDLDINLGLNLLGDIAPGLLDSVPGGTVAGGVLNDVVDSVLDTALAPHAPEIQNILEMATDTTDPIVNNTITGVNDVLADTNDAVLGLLNGDTEALNTLPETVLDTASNILDGVSTGLEGLTDNLSDGTALNNVTDLVESILSGGVSDLPSNPVTDLIEGILSGGSNDLPLNTVTDILETVTGGNNPVDGLGGLLGGLFGGGNNNDTDIQVALPIHDLSLNHDIVENITGDIDVGVTPVIDLFGNNETSNDAGDTDITVNLGIDILDTSLLSPPTLEIPLDFVESITGDIDLDLGVATNLLGNVAPDILDALPGGAAVPDAVMGVVGDVVDDLVSPITPEIQTVIESVTTITDPVVDGTVTAVNDLLADDITQVINDLLSNPAESLNDIITADILSPITGGGGTDGGLSSILPLWPENTSPPGADTLFDTVTNTIDILPDPIGNIVEGLGVLDLGGGGSSSGGGSGGLFGGLGGLFG